MIRENTLEEGKVVGLKLVTGEELLGLLVENTKSDLYLSKPRTLHIGEEGMGLVAYSMLADDTKVQQINRSTIATVFIPHSEFVESYVAAVEEKKIDVVEKPGIIMPK